MDLIDIETPDGTAEAYLTGAGRGVLFFIDAIGLRPQIAQMADRIAAWGYTVLAPNTLYRSGTAAQTSPQPGEDLRAPGGREEFFRHTGPRIAELTPERLRADIPAYLAALREYADGDGDLAVVGYCMGARLAVRAAGLDPRVVAVAGFHGGGLVTDDPDSPHVGLPHARAAFVFGHADQDRSMPPEAVAELGRALAEAGLTATNEIYPGSPHGYAMNDTSMYHEPGAERSFEELHALLHRTLGT